MKIEELIKELEDIRKFRGNIEVFIDKDEFEWDVDSVWEHPRGFNEEWVAFISI